ATTLGRPGAASSNQLFTPFVSSHCRARLAIISSPSPSSGAMLGFTDGVRISSLRTSKTSVPDTEFVVITRAPAFFRADLRLIGRYLLWSSKCSTRRELPPLHPSSSREAAMPGHRLEPQFPSCRVRRRLHGHWRFMGPRPHV